MNIKRTGKDTAPAVSIKKFIGQSDVSNMGAFAASCELYFEIGVSVAQEFSQNEPEVQLVVFPAETGENTGKTDGKGQEALTVNAVPMAKNTSRHCYGFYAALKLPMILANYGLECGLFRYYVRIILGDDSFYTCSVNNVDFSLVKNLPPTPFRLLCHKDTFLLPNGFGGGVMYQIFPDRFFAGNVKLPIRADAEFNPDWYNGIPQYGEYPGAFVKNNMFFGGNLYGVVEKLPYLSQMGVTCIYLNPIFKAYSNHKYDTSDYMSVDEMFGGDDALKMLIKEAHALGMKIVLDGVFNHTGDDSIYFDKYKKHGNGAYSCKTSPFRKWYNFKKYPEKYDSWWGIEILPKLNQNEKSCREFFTGSGGVCKKYAAMGIDGWRLDVADELPDIFLDEFRSSVKGANRDAIIIGEVWENAADKIAYGKLRQYFWGNQLDSVMNYPFKNAVIDFLLNKNSTGLYNTLTDIYSSYPKAVCDNLMNLIGTHDTDRILTVLSGENLEGMSNADLSTHKMSDELYSLAVRRLKVAATLQYTVFGFPSVYYGDEAGCEGGHDPFCRRPFPWGCENDELICHYKKLGELRRSFSCFDCGAFGSISRSESTICYKRSDKHEDIFVLANANEACSDVLLPIGFDGLITDFLTQKPLDCKKTTNGLCITLDGISAAVIVIKKQANKA